MKNHKGFTLSELIVSIGIIGTVGTLSVDKIDSILPIARDVQRKANIRQVQTALEIYHLYNNNYPSTYICNNPTKEGWKFLEKEIGEKAEEIYIPRFPEDPVNDKKYYFSYCSDGETYKIAYFLEEEKKGKVLEQGL